MNNFLGHCIILSKSGSEVHLPSFHPPVTMRTVLKVRGNMKGEDQPAAAMCPLVLQFVWWFWDS